MATIRTQHTHRDRWSVRALFLFLACWLAACSQSDANKIVVVGQASASPVQSVRPPRAVRSLPHLPPPAPPDPRTPDEIRQAACQGADGSWRCPSIRPLLRAGVPILPTAWTVPLWVVDPQNLTGCASDFNDCTNSACGGGTGIGPCRTWQEVSTHRWGCLGNPAACPRLRQATQISFLTSHTDGTDPVYLFPAMENGATLIVQGGSTIRSTTAICTPKNTATNAITNCTFASGPVTVGQLVINVSHPSRAWVYKNVSGLNFQITQPMVVTTPSGTLMPAEVDTWAEDSVGLTTLADVNIAAVAPVPGQNNGTVYLSNLNVFSPSGVSVDTLTIGGGGVTFIQAKSDRFIEVLNINSNILTGGLGGSYGFVATNSFFAGGGVFIQPIMIGGTMMGVSSMFNYDMIEMEVDGDTILGPSPVSLAFGGSVLEPTILGNVNFDGTVVMSGSAVVEHENTFYPGHTLWGVGAVHMFDSAHFLEQGSFVTAITNSSLTSAGFVMEGHTAACAATTANPAAIRCGLGPITPTNLDTAAGLVGNGFGGAAFQLVGTSGTIISTL